MIKKEHINDLIQESIDLKKRVQNEMLQSIAEAAELIIETIKKNKKVLICGNGGSAADSQHFAAELVGRFVKERDPLPAIALTVDTSFITAWSNDYSYDTIFSRQVEALGAEDDLLFAISTSGNSKNCIHAINTAKEKGLKTVSLTGKNGGKMKDMSDNNITVSGDKTYNIQESHIMIIHIICCLIEENI